MPGAPSSFLLLENSNAIVKSFLLLQVKRFPRKLLATGYVASHTSDAAAPTKKWNNISNLPLAVPPFVLGCFWIQSKVTNGADHVRLAWSYIYFLFVAPTSFALFSGSLRGNRSKQNTNHLGRVSVDCTCQNRSPKNTKIIKSDPGVIELLVGHARLAPLNCALFHHVSVKPNGTRGQVRVSSITVPEGYPKGP